MGTGREGGRGHCDERAIRLSRVACLIARRTIRGLGLHGRRPWHLVRRLPRPAPQPRGGWEPVSRDHAMRSVSRARAILQCTEKLNTVNAPSKDARLPLGYPCVLASAARPLPFSLASLSKKIPTSASKGLASLPPVLNTRCVCTVSALREGTPLAREAPPCLSRSPDQRGGTYLRSSFAVAIEAPPFLI